MIVLSKEVVSARLPQNRVNQLEDIAREEKVDKTTIIDRALENYIQEWRLEKAIETYRDGTSTLPRAAEIADTTIWEMINKLNERRIPSQYGLEELEEDLKAFNDE